MCANAFISCLKLSFEWVGNVVNHYNLAFFKVKEKAKHIIGSRLTEKSIDARNDSRLS